MLFSCLIFNFFTFVKNFVYTLHKLIEVLSISAPGKSIAGPTFDVVAANS